MKQSSILTFKKVSKFTVNSLYMSLLTMQCCKEKDFICLKKLLKQFSIRTFINRKKHQVFSRMQNNWQANNFQTYGKFEMLYLQAYWKS